MSSLKDRLDRLVSKYERAEFIKSDPISFPHRYSSRDDIITSAFIAAILAQGRRTAIMKNLGELFDYIGDSPHKYIEQFDFRVEKENLLFFKHFAYRNIGNEELTSLFYILSNLVKIYGNLYNFFKSCYSEDDFISFQKVVMDSFYEVTLPDELSFSPSLTMVLAHPKRGSGCKRLNMFLRWVVRSGVVDFGVLDFIDKKDLIIPLDTHVSKLSRTFGLTFRKGDNMKTALEITENLRLLDRRDPIKYDFALFGYGIDAEERCEKK